MNKEINILRVGCFGWHVNVKDFMLGVISRGDTKWQYIMDQNLMWKIICTDIQRFNTKISGTEGVK